MWTALRIGYCTAHLHVCRYSGSFIEHLGVTYWVRIIPDHLYLNKDHLSSQFPLTHELDF